MSFNSIQAVPEHVIGQLNKCLREVILCVCECVHLCWHRTRSTDEVRIDLGRVHVLRKNKV